MMINQKHSKTHGNTMSISPSSQAVDKDEANDKNNGNWSNVTTTSPNNTKEKTEISPAARDENSRIATLLQTAERHFLQKQYKDALFTVNEAFLVMSMTARRNDSIKRQHNQQASNEVLCLSPPIRLAGRRRKFHFSVFFADDDPRMSSDAEKSVAYSLAVIGLQAWHELSAKEVYSPVPSKRARSAATPSISKQAWKHLEPILRYFTDCVNGTNDSFGHLEGQSYPRELSMDLFVVWIPFWKSHGFDREAFVWATQLLLAVSSRTRDVRKEAKMSRNEEAIWLHYVSDQLPRLSHPATASKILRYISASNELTTSGDFPLCFDESLISHIAPAWDGRRLCPETVDYMLETIETLVNEGGEERKVELNLLQGDSIVSVSSLTKAHKRLLKICQMNEKRSNTRAARQQRTESNPHAGPDSATLQHSSSTGPNERHELANLSISKNWKSKFSGISSFLHFATHASFQRNKVLDWVSRTLHGAKGTGNSNAENDKTMAQRRRKLQTIALSLALLLLSWRQRRWVGRLGKSVAFALLAPIRELVDALVTPSPRSLVQDERTRGAS
jgi:hypothetical protein